MGPSNICSACNLDDCDLQLQGCGCFLHVTCCPLSLILDAGTKPPEATLPVGPVKTQSLVCGICGSGPVSGVRVLPLSFEPLEKAVKLRSAASSTKHHASHSSKSSAVLQVSGQMLTRDDEMSEREIETAQVVFSMGKRTLATNKSDSDTQRTGRWGDEEIAFVEYLVKSFDHGQLPIAHGTKLSEFIGDLLLCKASRLTKKMKNAKLARSFEMVAPDTTAPTDFRHDGKVANKLERGFIQSLATEYTQLEIGFNLRNYWRSCFSELCLQVGYAFLDASLYLASLDDYERRSSLAEERMRKVRRKRMGFTTSANSNEQNSSMSDEQNAPQVPASEPLTSVPTVEKVNDSSIFPEMGIPALKEAHHDNEFDSYLPAVLSQAQHPFLEAIVKYLEQHNLPFQHADAWVPSFVEGTNDEVQLFHAGSVTRRDIKDDKVWSALENFGEYSKGFTFTPGVGIVGRVYSSGETEWECDVNELDPKAFLRAGGAKEYGVRTVTGIPYSTSGVGRMVVVLYSCNHVQEDDAMMNRCAEEFSRYSPEPKWKLVIDIVEDKEAESPPPFVCEIGPNSHGQNIPIGDQFTKSSREMNTITPRSGGDPSGEDVTIQEIISLLSEQVALHHSRSPSDEESSATNVLDSSTLFRELMSIRLMLLRPKHRWSSEESEIVELLKCSYKAYSSSGNVQSGDELAILLAREWSCLTRNAR